MLARRHAAMIDIDLEVRSGAPGDHVVDAADTEDADPIAMACRNVSIQDKPRAATGAGVTVLGGVLTVAGLAGLALLTADPGASLYLYVSRTAVVLVGLLLLLRAVLLSGEPPGTRRI